MLSVGLQAIIIVGYDTTAPTPYWKLRNSWGVGYGEEGYFRIAMNDPGQGEWGLFGMLAESALVRTEKNASSYDKQICILIMTFTAARGR